MKVQVYWLRFYSHLPVELHTWTLMILFTALWGESQLQGWHWSVSSLFILPREKNKAEIKISARHREKLIFFYSLYNQSTADPDTDNENLPSKLLFSCTDPRGVFVSARRGMIPTALSICSIVATRRFSSLIVSFRKKKRRQILKAGLSLMMFLKIKLMWQQKPKQIQLGAQRHHEDHHKSDIIFIRYDKISC